MNDKTYPSASGPGISFLGALGLIFIVLKLMGRLDWPWIWVLAPLWAPFVLVFFFLIVAGVVIGIGQLIKRLAAK